MFKRKDKANVKRTYTNSFPFEMNIMSFNTQYCSMSKYADSTVIKTPDSVLKGNLYSKTNRFLSEEYLLNYRTNNNNLGFRAGLSNFFQQNASMTAANKELEEDLTDIIYLPKFSNIKAPIGATMTLRRSIRKYECNIMSKQELSNILYYAQGISGEINLSGNMGGNNRIKLRNTPSGGGLYPVNLYMYLSNVSGVKEGIYLYYPYCHGIKPINLDVQNINKYDFAEFGSIIANNLNIFFIYVFNMYINSRKYGDAGAAFAFIEAGEIGENIQMISTAIGYGSCDIGGYEKQYLENMLRIDGLTNQVIHMTIIGKEEK